MLQHTLRRNALSDLPTVEAVDAEIAALQARREEIIQGKTPLILPTTFMPDWDKTRLIVSPRFDIQGDLKIAIENRDRTRSVVWTNRAGADKLAQHLDRAMVKENEAKIS